MKISNPGFYTTIQDLGRYGYQSTGIPVSGAMDDYSFRIANMLVSNEERCAALEFTLAGPTIVFEEKTVFALACDAEASLNDSKIERWRSYKVEPGDALKIGRIKRGCRGYISFSGGIDSPLILGSRSCCTAARIGRPLRAGDAVKLKSAESAEKRLESRYIPQWKNRNRNRVRVIFGPQDDHFTDKGVDTFLSSEYRVTDHSDRMGYRLEGNAIEHKNKKKEIISDGNPLGAVQVPGDGKPIVLMKDRQTTGGYPKIATVITADVMDIAQMKTGDSVSFEPVTLERGYAIAMEYRRKLEEIRTSLSTSVVKKYKIIINGNEYHVEVEEL